MNREILIGHAPVDSGSIVIGDPCYIVDAGITWPEVVDRMFDDKGNYRKGEKETTAINVNGTFMTSTPHGDGQYPVYAEVDERGQVVSIRIELDQDEEDSDECECCGERPDWCDCDDEEGE
jgi:hypothetical protein